MFAHDSYLMGDCQAQNNPSYSGQDQLARQPAPVPSRRLHPLITSAACPLRRVDAGPSVTLASSSGVAWGVHRGGRYPIVLH